MAKKTYNGNGRNGKLTVKQELFWREFVVDFNGTKAAIRAGYAKSGAHVVASNLLKLDKVKAKIEEWRQRQAKRIDVTVDEIVAEYRKIAFQNIDDYKEAGEAESLAGVLETLTRDQAAAIASITERTTKSGTSFSFRFHDKKGALDSLGKYKGMFTEKLQVETVGDKGVPIDELGLSLSVRLTVLKAIRKRKAKQETIDE